MENKAIKLDLKDKKLLYELDFNARLSYTQLAKKIGLSKQGVEYKLNNLVKKEVIMGFYPVVNVPKLGHFYCRLMVNFQNVTQSKEKEIISYLKKDNRFFWVFTSQGTWELLCAIWAPSLSDFKETINDFLAKYGKYVRTKHESIATEVIHYQHRYLLGKRQTKEINLKETDGKTSLTENEKKVLTLLCENARMPTIEVANRAKISPKAVAYTIKKLEREKIIEAYRPIINHNKLGYTYFKLWIRIHQESKEEMEKLYSQIKNNPIVIYVVRGIGLLEDLDVEIMVRNNYELYDFIKKLKQDFPNLIGEYKTFMYIDTKKVRYLPF